MKVDLNADLGEGFGPWPMGADTAMMDVISSANIACGFHAGDPDQMLKSMSAAVARGVGLGAHPGFPDLQGFGRRPMQMSHAEVANMVTYQTGAAMAMARAAGGACAMSNCMGPWPTWPLMMRPLHAPPMKGRCGRILT